MRKIQYAIFAADSFVEDVTINSQFATSEAGGGSNLGNDWDPIAFGQGRDDYLIWTVEVLSGGSLILNLTDVDLGSYEYSDTASVIALNGLRITSVVPEPATYALFGGLGALALAAWRRRGRR